MYSSFSLFRTPSSRRGPFGTPHGHVAARSVPFHTHTWSRRGPESVPDDHLGGEEELVLGDGEVAERCARGGTRSVTLSCHVMGTLLCHVMGTLCALSHARCLPATRPSCPDPICDTLILSRPYPRHACPIQTLSATRPSYPGPEGHLQACPPSHSAPAPGSSIPAQYRLFRSKAVVRYSTSVPRTTSPLRVHFSSVSSSSSSRVWYQVTLRLRLPLLSYRHIDSQYQLAYYRTFI